MFAFDDDLPNARERFSVIAIEDIVVNSLEIDLDQDAAVVSARADLGSRLHSESDKYMASSIGQRKPTTRAASSDGTNDFDAR